MYININISNFLLADRRLFRSLIPLSLRTTSRMERIATYALYQHAIHFSKEFSLTLYRVSEKLLPATIAYTVL